MKRRTFLLGAPGAAAAIAIPELWVPKKTFFLPPTGGWRAAVLTNHMTIWAGSGRIALWAGSGRIALPKDANVGDTVTIVNMSADYHDALIVENHSVARGKIVNAIRLPDGWIFT